MPGSEQQVYSFLRQSIGPWEDQKCQADYCYFPLVCLINRVNTRFDSFWHNLSLSLSLSLSLTR